MRWLGTTVPVLKIRDTGWSGLRLGCQRVHRSPYAAASRGEEVAVTTELALALADEEHPARVVGFVFGRVLILGLIIWWIVHMIRKRRRRRSGVQHPPRQPFWDGTAWQYPHPGAPQPQPYWDGAAWQHPQHYQAHLPQQQYPTHQQQPYQQQYPQQPPYPGAPYR